MEVDATKYWGVIEVWGKGLDSRRLYQKDVYAIIMTGFHDASPLQRLKKGAVITWTLPIERLEGSQERPFTIGDLKGTFARTELREAGVVPPRSLFPPREHAFSGDNAAQQSANIKIE